MLNKIGKTAITLILTALAVYAVWFSWIDRKIRYEDYSYSKEEAEELKCFPKAMYDYGKFSQNTFDDESARRFYRKAAAGNVFDGDAWMALAETEARLGNFEEAKRILLFMDTLAKRTVRWKWRQMLLARELGMEKLFQDNIRFLMDRKHRINDVVQVLDFQVGQNPEKTMIVLDQTFYPDYFKWLLRWNREEDARKVWEKMGKTGARNKEMAELYIDFLLKEKMIARAAEIRREFLNIEGMTNSGFEDSLKKSGFGWKYWGENKGVWNIDRVERKAAEGKYALRILFSGKENLNFRNLYQLVDVKPKTRYALSYQFRSRNITTDQGPFIEIYGYDVNGFRVNGNMIIGSALWTKETIEFETPEECHGVAVRVRRQKSRRFDNKIDGELWLDDFSLKASEKRAECNIQR